MRRRGFVETPLSFQQLGVDIVDLRVEAAVLLAERVGVELRLLHMVVELGGQGGHRLVDVGDRGDQAVDVGLELLLGDEVVHGLLEELLGDELVAHCSRNVVG